MGYHTSGATETLLASNEPHSGEPGGLVPGTRPRWLLGTMTDRTVSLATPWGGHRFALAGKAEDDSVIGVIPRNHGHYEPHLMQLMRRRLAPDAISLDIGANVGPLTLVMSECSPDGHVHAFEPAGETFEYLVRNLDVNGAANVTAHRLAFYNSSSRLQLSYTAGFAGGSFLSSTAYSEGETETITTVRLDDWVQEHGLKRIDLVKLDVEGAELRVLEGGRRTLTRLRPDLIVEFNPLTMRRFHEQNPWDLFDQLRKLYPLLYYVRNDGDIIRIISRQHVAKLLARGGYVDLFCSSRPLPTADARYLEPLRGVKDAARATVAYNRWRLPTKNFVIEPSYGLQFGINELRGQSGQLVRVGIAVNNTSRFWYSSRFPEHAVCVSYHWLSEDGNVVERDGIRTFLPAALGPGRRLAFEMTVQLPLNPGRYTLLVSLVQENFLWFYKLDPSLGHRLPTMVV